MLANRILANENVLDAFGHVSVRHPSDAGRFLIARSLSPAQVTVNDLQLFDVEGARVGGDQRASYAELAIHAGIYRRRPDASAVCHSHAAPAIPFSVTDVPLRPITHVGAVMGHSAPVWDSAHGSHGSADRMLVTTAEQGNSLAATLGDASVALMRGHGYAVAATDLRACVMIAIRVMADAGHLATALALGPVTYLSAAEVERSRSLILAPLSMDRAWGYWISRLRPPG